MFYGVVIVTMMRLKPAGLWPSAARRREMQVDEDDSAAIEAELTGTAATAAPGGGADGGEN